MPLPALLAPLAAAVLGAGLMTSSPAPHADDEPASAGRLAGPGPGTAVVGDDVRRGARRRGLPGGRQAAGPIRQRAERAGRRGALRGLELSDEQRGRVRAVVEQHREGLKTTRESLRAARQALHAAARADALQEGLVRDSAQRLGSARGEAAIRRARLGAELRTVLDGEQLQRLQSLRAARAEQATRRRPARR